MQILKYTNEKLILRQEKWEQEKKPFILYFYMYFLKKKKNRQYIAFTIYIEFKNIIFFNAKFNSQTVILFKACSSLSAVY